jgi:hypothetical protein
MELGNFSSIFEIFATLTLAYILIDELLPIPFVSLITEKVLRRYRIIDETYVDIRSKISGRQTSLSNIAQMQIPEVQKLDEYDRLLKSTSERAEQSFTEVKALIRSDGATKSFAFLNCFLFLFCITMLFYGGAYASEENQIDKIASEKFHYRVDFSLFLFSTISFLYLLFSWIYDKKGKEENSNESNVGVFDRIRKGKIMNGYILSSSIWLLISGISILSYFLGWKLPHFQDTVWHDLLILGCIILPMANFLVYMMKASKRAKKTFPEVKNIVDVFYNDYTAELKRIDQYIAACGFRESNLSVYRTTSEQPSGSPVGAP